MYTHLKKKFSQRSGIMYALLTCEMQDTIHCEIFILSCPHKKHIFKLYKTATVPVVGGHETWFTI